MKYLKNKQENSCCELIFSSDNMSGFQIIDLVISSRLAQKGMQLQNWTLVGLLVFLYLFPEKDRFSQNPIIYEEKQLTQLSTTL